MKNEKIYFVVGIFVGAALMAVASCFIMEQQAVNMRTMAIENRAADWVVNPGTGKNEFVWKSEEVLK
jgi:hypothetical protein